MPGVVDVGARAPGAAGPIWARMTHAGFVADLWRPVRVREEHMRAHLRHRAPSSKPGGITPKRTRSWHKYVTNEQLLLVHSLHVK